MELTKERELEKRFTEQFAAKIRVVVEEDATVTLSGIGYRDFSALVNAAQSELCSKPPKPEVLATPDDGYNDLRRSNTELNESWYISQLSLIRVIDKLKARALQAHNDAVWREERAEKRSLNPRWLEFVRKRLAAQARSIAKALESDKC